MERSGQERVEEVQMEKGLQGERVRESWQGGRRELAGWSGFNWLLGLEGQSSSAPHAAVTLH